MQTNQHSKDLKILLLELVFDTPLDIINNINKIKSQALDSDIMPPGNLTGMTQVERDKISLWISQGASISKLIGMGSIDLHKYQVAIEL